MEKFGYTISKGRQIDYESNDRRIADYIFERNQVSDYVLNAVDAQQPAQPEILQNSVSGNFIFLLKGEKMTRSCRT